METNEASTAAAEPVDVEIFEQDEIVAGLAIENDEAAERPDQNSEEEAASRSGGSDEDDERLDQNSELAAGRSSEDELELIGQIIRFSGIFLIVAVIVFGCIKCTKNYNTIRREL